MDRVWAPGSTSAATRVGMIRASRCSRGEEAEQGPFLAADRPWDRADLVANGTPAGAYGPGELIVADPPGRMAG